MLFIINFKRKSFVLLVIPLNSIQKFYCCKFLYKNLLGIVTLFLGGKKIGVSHLTGNPEFFTREKKGPINFYFPAKFSQVFFSLGYNFGNFQTETFPVKKLIGIRDSANYM